MPEDEIVAVIGTETSPRSIPSSARRAYDGFQCNECRRVCGVVDQDGRCQTCGPLHAEQPELPESEKSIAAFQREREMIERRRSDRVR
jgi:hypothetical protein